MEKNNTANIEFCSNGCGFYSNPMFNNMCSKCFKDQQKKNMEPEVIKDLPIGKVDASAVPKLEKTELKVVDPQCSKISINNPNEIEQKVEDEASTIKPKQANPGRCFTCRAKISLVKQSTNKCRCSFTFCDDHRTPENHNCLVDIVQHDKEVLSKFNPKIHNKPRAGNQFTRID